MRYQSSISSHILIPLTSERMALIFFADGVLSVTAGLCSYLHRCQLRLNYDLGLGHLQACFVQFDGFVKWIESIWREDAF